MIRCRLMDTLYMAFDSVLIPLASDAMHEFHGIEWNFHILFYCSTIRVSEESQISPSKITSSTIRPSLFVTGSGNLFVGQKKKSSTDRERYIRLDADKM